MSLMSDVTRQVKHPPTCTIHSPFTRKNKKWVFCFFEKCVQILIKRHAYAYMSSSLVGSSSSGSGGVERKGYKQTAVLA